MTRCQKGACACLSCRTLAGALLPGANGCALKSVGLKLLQRQVNAKWVSFRVICLHDILKKGPGAWARFLRSQRELAVKSPEMFVEGESTDLVGLTFP